MKNIDELDAEQLEIDALDSRLATERLHHSHITARYGDLCKKLAKLGGNGEDAVRLKGEIQRTEAIITGLETTIGERKAQAKRAADPAFKKATAAHEKELAGLREQSKRIGERAVSIREELDSLIKEDAVLGARILGMELNPPR